MLLLHGSLMSRDAPLVHLSLLESEIAFFGLLIGSLYTHKTMIHSHNGHALQNKKNINGCDPESLSTDTQLDRRTLK